MDTVDWAVLAAIGSSLATLGTCVQAWLARKAEPERTRDIGALLSFCLGIVGGAAGAVAAVGLILNGG